MTSRAALLSPDQQPPRGLKLVLNAWDKKKKYVYISFCHISEDREDFFCKPSVSVYLDDCVNLRQAR